jgi:hypothetical protein
MDLSSHFRLIQVTDYHRLATWMSAQVAEQQRVMKLSITTVSLVGMCLTACGPGAASASSDLANAPAAASNGAGDLASSDQTSTNQATPFPSEAREAWIATQRRNCNTPGDRFDARGIRFEAFNGRNGNEAAVGANIFRAADFNGDGRSDFIMITNDGGCRTSGNEGDTDFGMIGERGIPHDFLVSGPRGYQLESETLVGDDLMSKVVRRGDRDVIELRFTAENALPRDYGRCGLVAQVVFGWANGTMG